MQRVPHRFQYKLRVCMDALRERGMQIRYVALSARSAAEGSEAPAVLAVRCPAERAARNSGRKRERDATLRQTKARIV